VTAKGDELDLLCAQAREAFAGAATLQVLRETRARFLGRKGSVSGKLREIGANRACHAAAIKSA
jgi:hypothetical protein